MSAAPLLAGLAMLLGLAGAWELIGGREDDARRAASGFLAALTAGRARSLASTALWLGLPQRLRRAGLGERLPVAGALALKLAGAIVGAGVSALAVPAAPARLALPLAAAFPVAGFLVPDAMMERVARQRRQRLADALPDALDLLAVGAASGRSPVAVMREIAATEEGPLARELAVTVADIAAGNTQADALEALRQRLGGGEVAAMVAALARSQRHGSPLADQLRDQATELRREQRRRLEERASRAAPKIQLVVALVLVPSVLLLIVAGLLANSGRLLGGL